MSRITQGARIAANVQKAMVSSGQLGARSVQVGTSGEGRAAGSIITGSGAGRSLVKNMNQAFPLASAGRPLSSIVTAASLQGVRLRAVPTKDASASAVRNFNDLGARPKASAVPMGSNFQAGPSGSASAAILNPSPYNPASTNPFLQRDLSGYKPSGNVQTNPFHHTNPFHDDANKSGPRERAHSLDAPVTGAKIKPPLAPKPQMLSATGIMASGGSSTNASIRERAASLEGLLGGAKMKPSVAPKPQKLSAAGIMASGGSSTNASVRERAHSLDIPVTGAKIKPPLAPKPQLSAAIMASGGSSTNASVRERAHSDPGVGVTKSKYSSGILPASEKLGVGGKVRKAAIKFMNFFRTSPPNIRSDALQVKDGIVGKVTVRSLDTDSLTEGTTKEGTTSDK